MRYLTRPWAPQAKTSEVAFGPSDCLLGELDEKPPHGLEYVELLSGSMRGKASRLALFPYPKRKHAENPQRHGFPLPPRKGQDPVTPEEETAAEALRHMNEVLARIQELEEVLDDSGDTWGRLRAAWKKAENEANPSMAEIVRQSRRVQPILKELTKRIRRVLRRQRELTPLDRVQEMDRASMVWLSRQPGRSIRERAGSSQRIMATVRRENFDTLENRVLHAYAGLASDVAREWLREHPRASESERFKKVLGFRKACKALAQMLRELGVMVAQADINPNYVLIQDKGYREVYESWRRLLLRKKIEDELWAWQAETWTDFVVLAMTLAIDELDEAELVAQSPISWRGEAVGGRWFEQDRPISVFWLRKTNRIVEIQSRPEVPGSLLLAAKAHVALRITDPSRLDVPRRVAVWTPHAMERLELESDASDAASLLQQIQQLRTGEILRHGLIMTPARGNPGALSKTLGNVRVKAIALGPSGEDLARGFAEVRNFVRSEIYEASE